MPFGQLLPAACLALLIWAVGPVPPAAADPSGATVAQVELNRDTAKLEVALKLDPRQVKQALSAFFGKPFDWHAADTDQRLQGYLAATFAIELPSADPDEPGPALELQWIGHERVSHREAWLYFELSVPARQLEKGLYGLMLHQRMFFEILEHQLNTLRLKDGDLLRTYTLSRENPSQIVAP